MKTRSLFLTLTLGLVAGLFACQDVGIMAPDDLQPQFGKGGNKPPKDPPPPIGAELAGLLNGTAAEGWSWNYKKDVFRANGSMEVDTDLSGIDVNDCMISPEDANADHLMDALSGLSGTTAILRVDMANLEAASEVNRITSYVGEGVVRYFWVGPLGEFDGSSATVSEFVDSWDADGTITYTLTGGVLGVRDTGSPSSVVKIACPYTGSVTVTVNKVTP